MQCRGKVHLGLWDGFLEASFPAQHRRNKSWISLLSSRRKKKKINLDSGALQSEHGDNSQQCSTCVFLANAPQDTAKSSFGVVVVWRSLENLLQFAEVLLQIRMMFGVTELVPVTCPVFWNSSGFYLYQNYPGRFHTMMCMSGKCCWHDFEACGHV